MEAVAEATPLIASRRRSRSAWTLLPDYWQIWQRTDLAFRTRSAFTPIVRQCLSSCSYMARLGTKATLLCAHGPTILTNPEPCSADFLSTFIATGRMQDTYPCPHVMTRTIIYYIIRKMIVWKIFSLLYYNYYYTTKNIFQTVIPPEYT